MKLALTYISLALIATAMNIASQHLFSQGYRGDHQVLLSLIIGTGVGLFVKYWLDKRYIFRFRAEDLREDGKTFGLYVLMGLFTTAIFWGMELAFDFIFHTEGLRYVGATTGLLIGYFVKYRLDRQFVFRSKVEK